MKKKTSTLSQKLATACVAPNSLHIQCLLFTTGIILLVGSLSLESLAYTPQANYNDARIAEATDVIMRYINGAFGSLVMAVAGIAAIMSSAFGQYRAALGLLAVAVGSFILRSLIGTFFNDDSLQFNNIRD